VTRPGTAFDSWSTTWRPVQRCDVAAGGEHHRHLPPADQSAHRSAAADQLQQLQQLAQATALQATGLDGGEGVTVGHQLALQPVGDPQPVDLPAVGQAIGHRQGRKQVTTGAAGGDQEPGHGRRTGGA
jgi:hypothetical protein